VQEFLRRQLSHAMPLAFEKMEDAGENRVFVAESDMLRFVAPMPGHLARGGPHVQWLTIESDADGLRLVFDHSQLNGYDPDNPKGSSTREPVMLLEKMQDARFEYRALDEQGELTDWDESWDDAQRLPLMVRLVVEFDDDSRFHWPDFEVPILSATATPGFFGFANPSPVTGGDPQRPDGGGQ
jgi:general secretion pathway protein J